MSISYRSASQAVSFHQAPLFNGREALLRHRNHWFESRGLLEVSAQEQADHDAPSERWPLSASRSSGCRWPGYRFKTARMGMSHSAVASGLLKMPTVWQNNVQALNALQSFHD